MSLRRWAMVAVGLVLVVAAVWQILAARQGLQIVTLDSANPPVTLFAPEGVDPGGRPLVLVGHGFAGSTAIMRGFAYTLAHAGYAVAAWDFQGHGRNPAPMPPDMSGQALLADAESARAQALAHGWGDPDRVAILGHSMGSGVALRFGQESPETAATIAVSPVGQPVTPALPRNLLLMAGQWESRFAENARARLAEAGGAGGDPSGGSARELTVVPGVEHLSILFSSTAHRAARDWLDRTFGPQEGARDAVDRRVRWYGLGLLGTVLAATGLGPLLAAAPSRARPSRPLAWRLGTLVGGAVAATLGLWLAGQAGLVVRDLLGLLMGGYLLIWFCVAGLVSLLLLWSRPARPSGRALLGGLTVGAALWLGMGLLGQTVWLPWWLIPRRLVLWPLGVLLLLPWFLAAGEVMRGAGRAARAGWWLAHSGAVVGSLVLGLMLTPELGFLVLILPLFPAVLGIHAAVAGAYRDAWSFALGGALFVAWLLLAVFPLQ